MTVNHITKEDGIKENGACAIMIKVFPGLSGLNLEKKCQAGQQQVDLSKVIQRRRENLPNLLTTQEGLWGTHNLDPVLAGTSIALRYFLSWIW